MGKFYALCLPDSLRERVHVVQSNPLLKMLHDSVPYKTALRKGLKPNEKWQSKLIYVNRFFHNDDMEITKNSSN